MAGPARVVSVDALVDFKSGLQVFREDVSDALVAVDLECQRLLDWIKNTQIKSWQTQLRKREERLNEAKADLHRKKLTSMNEFSSHVDEKATVKKMQRLVEEAEAKISICRKWAMAAQEAIEEYQASAMGLSGTLEVDLPKAMNSLQQSIKALDAYLAAQLPSTGIGGLVGGMSTAASGAGSPSSTEAAEGGGAAGEETEGGEGDGGTQGGETPTKPQPDADETAPGAPPPL